jgi:thiamine-phosphate pyrophosphorylase
MVNLHLYLVTDEALAGGRPLAGIVGRAVDGGVTCVQLRAKTATSRTLLALAQELLALLRPRGVPLIVNDRLDIALAAGADGVHVGQEDLPCDRVRRLVPPGFCVGVSVSNEAEARAAEAAGADYLGISPVFVTPTKRDTPPAAGLDGLRRIRAATRLPLVGIGGIHAGNCAAVRAAGADGIAVVSAIMAADDPAAAARRLA